MNDAWGCEILNGTVLHVFKIIGGVAITQWSMNIGKKIMNAYVSGENFIAECEDGLRIYDRRGVMLSRTFR